MPSSAAGSPALWNPPTLVSRIRDTQYSRCPQEPAPGVDQRGLRFLLRLMVKWVCSRRTSLRDVELAKSELAKALDSVELQQMVGWLATQYQRGAAKAKKDGQFSAAVGALNALRAMVVQPQLDRQFERHYRGRHAH